MKPVVNGLEESFQEQVSFLSLNAAAEGAEAFAHYAMPGHPSYLLLSPAGQVLWKAFGPIESSQVETVIEAQLQ